MVSWAIFIEYVKEYMIYGIIAIIIIIYFTRLWLKSMKEDKIKENKEDFFDRKSKRKQLVTPEIKEDKDFYGTILDDTEAIESMMRVRLDEINKKIDGINRKGSELKKDLELLEKAKQYYEDRIC